ncbi:cAMP-specific 3',5'-cyclic phosphodiesterase 4D [Trichonephila clavipes]|nr:cAMP-specific 3',5'-cyclic phosphodiesterase 4D [Trichonephila clavipes]
MKYKQQELDLPALCGDEGSAGKGSPLSQISGVKKPLCHTNSLTQLPKYGVETEHEMELGKLLEDTSKWGLDVFKMDTFSSQRPLTAVVYQIFRERDLLKTFKIPSKTLLNYLMTLEDHYLKVPYHNRLHACDVTQSVHVLLSSPALELLTDLTYHRVRRRNVNFDYEARGDPIDDPTLKYNAEFYFLTLDKAINALESRKADLQKNCCQTFGGGLYARRPVVCVPLTRQHRKARLQWCREHHNWTEQDWTCELFSDESRFSLSSDCRRQLIWRESGTAYRPDNIQEKDRYPTCSIMVWAGIMINGRTRLHVVANGTMTSQRYIDEVLLPHYRLFRGAVGDKFVFMDDNATCHRTLAV